MKALKLATDFLQHIIMFPAMFSAVYDSILDGYEFPVLFVYTRWKRVQAVKLLVQTNNCYMQRLPVITSSLHLQMFGWPT